jgi:hypothetical protein
MTDTTPAHQVRFPGFDTLLQAHTWDETTRAVVLARIDQVPPVTFFTDVEERTARALLDCLLAQRYEPRIPVVELIDARLAVGESDGYRYAEMPEDGEAWRRSLAYLEDDARAKFAVGFDEITIADQHLMIHSIQAERGTWHGLPADRVFGLWMRYACTAFYSHPWAWNEIGFGGPAYPRGYKNIGVGRREPWEVAEVDARDPVPWAERVDAARRRHEHVTSTDPGA